MASACVSSKISGELREKANVEDSPDDEDKSVLDDLTSSSSLLEFLSHEHKQKFLEELLEGASSDVDESIFEEINRLSNTSDDRSVEEILKEAEMLMLLTSPAVASGKDENIRKPCPEANLENEKDTLKASLERQAGSDMEKVVPGDDIVIVDEFDVDGKVENQESSPLQSPETPIEVISVENSRDKCIGTDIQFLDKSTNPSPRSLTPVNDVPWPPRERALEDEISRLQEQLKDTEERFHSLRLQHDTMSSHHRSLRESQSMMQEETERLKLEVQHLTECAGVLRTEVQAARSDRAEAQEVLKVLQTELEEARAEKRKLQEQTDRDAKVILDLQRQCKEMERILMRKHPDSVSALIVASKGVGNAKEEASTRRVLEQRIAQLETDAKEQDAKAQKILANVQAKFSTVQSKYETHIADLETQVLSLQDLNTKLTHKIESQSAIIRERNSTVYASIFTQTEEQPEREFPIEKISTGTQTDQKIAVGKPSSTPATVKKSVSSSRIVNSFSESQINHGNDPHLMATIRGMRVDLAIKEKALQRLTRELEECKKTIRKTQQKEREAGLAPIAKTITKKVSEADGQNNVEAIGLKEAQNKIKLLEFDYKSLHDKRLQDLRTLQAAHEKELASCHETVNILQQRLKERDEAFAMQKRRRVPVDYYALKAKMQNTKRLRNIYQKVARNSSKESHVFVNWREKSRITHSTFSL